MKIVFILIILLKLSAQNISKVTGPVKYIYDSTKTENLKAFVFSPPKKSIKEVNPAIVIFHGGGWEIGEAAWAFGRAKHFASLGFIAIAAQYRLSNYKDITPVEAMTDAKEIIKWIRLNSTKLRVDPNKLVAYGWSAGAHLATSAAIFNDSLSTPNALALVSPAVTLDIYGDAFRKLLLHRVTINSISPDKHVRKGLPPTIIVQGRDDTVTPLSAVQKFVDKMKSAGNQCDLIVYDDVGHLFTPSSEPDNGYPNPDKEVRAKAYKQIDLFLKNLNYINK